MKTQAVFSQVCYNNEKNEEIRRKLCRSFPRGSYAWLRLMLKRCLMESWKERPQFDAVSKGFSVSIVNFDSQ